MSTHRSEAALAIAAMSLAACGDGFPFGGVVRIKKSKRYPITSEFKTAGPKIKGKLRNTRCKTCGCKRKRCVCTSKGGQGETGGA